jgi:hypothetical protein
MSLLVCHVSAQCFLHSVPCKGDGDGDGDDADDMYPAQCATLPDSHPPPDFLDRAPLMYTSTLPTQVALVCMARVLTPVPLIIWVQAPVEDAWTW